ncbi:MAG TPA: hypothetical protein VLJ57_13170 [Burkholderiaceae bacterium]|nr:hypothetical protein [Burkholderiaceae bacterium]
MTALAGIDLGRVADVEQIVRDWLAEPELLILAGRWENGAVMEIVPRSPPILTPERYEGRFAGLRDLLLDGEGHHVHMDLGRLTQVTYLVAPSVCFGFRPSFELRLHEAGADPRQNFGLGFSVRRPYRNGLASEAVMRYFSRFRSHHAAYSKLVSFAAIDGPSAVPNGEDFGWTDIVRVALGRDTGDCRCAADLARLIIDPVENTS